MCIGVAYRADAPPRRHGVGVAAQAARDALYAKRDQLTEKQLRAKFQFGRMGSRDPFRSLIG
jgi:hypothetical protein